MTLGLQRFVDVAMNGLQEAVDYVTTAGSYVDILITKDCFILEAIMITDVSSSELELRTYVRTYYVS